MAHYPLLEGQRCLQGPIWSSKGKAIPADAKHGQAFENNLKDKFREKKKKNGKMGSAGENVGQLATDGCLFSSNYTDEGSFSHL